MYKKINKKAAFLISLVLFLSLIFVACSPAAELTRAAKGLTWYRISAEYNADNHTISAHQKVDYVNNYDVPLNFAAFHLYPNAFRKGAKFNPVSEKSQAAAYIDGISYGYMEITNLTVDGFAAPINITGEDQNILQTDFKDPLYPTAKFRIEFDFKLYLPKVNHRYGYNEHTVNLGNWYPIAAVYENGGFETSPYYSNGDPFFSSVANYEINFTAPSDYVVASSGEATAEQNGSKTLHKLTALCVRDFALALSKEFKIMQASVGHTLISYYYFEDDAPQNSLAAATDSISTYNDLFGKYPYPTYAVVQTPFLHGGMEYPALVMISSRYSGDIYREIIIHESAHQYWYAVVGNNQISEAWLDEGLAEYSTSLFYEKNPQYNITLKNRIAEAMRNYILYVDVLKTLTGEMNTSMNRRSNEFEEFEYICMVYTKGHLMFDSLHKLLKDDFYAGLRRYYGNNKFKIATKEDMIGAFEWASKKQLSAYFDSWLSGKVQIFDL